MEINILACVCSTCIDNIVTGRKHAIILRIDHQPQNTAILGNNRHIKQPVIPNHRRSEHEHRPFRKFFQQTRNAVFRSRQQRLTTEQIAATGGRHGEFRKHDDARLLLRRLLRQRQNLVAIVIDIRHSTFWHAQRNPLKSVHRRFPK